MQYDGVGVQGIRKRLCAARAISYPPRALEHLSLCPGPAIPRPRPSLPRKLKKTARIRGRGKGDYGGDHPAADAGPKQPGVDGGMWPVRDGICHNKLRAGDAYTRLQAASLCPTSLLLPWELPGRLCTKRVRVKFRTTKGHVLVTEMVQVLIRLSHVSRARGNVVWMMGLLVFATGDGVNVFALNFAAQSLLEAIGRCGNQKLMRQMMQNMWHYIRARHAWQAITHISRHPQCSVRVKPRLQCLAVARAPLPPAYNFHGFHR